MAEETYLIAKAVLRNFKASQRFPRANFLSSSTITACAHAAQNLAQLNITAEERELLGRASSIEVIESFVSQYVEEVEKTKRHSKAWKKVYAFSQFAGPVLKVFKQANFTPECSLALGLIGLLLIQPLNNKSEIEDRLELEISQLKDVISRVKFSNSMIRSQEINTEVQGLSAAIIDFLVHALNYQKKPGIIKVLDSIITDFAKRFQVFVDKIRGHAAKIDALAQRGYTAILVQSKEILDTTAQAIAEMQTALTVQAATNALEYAQINDKIERCWKSIDYISQIEAIKYTHQISNILYHRCLNQEIPKLLIRQQSKGLAPRERWEHNVSEIQAPSWLVGTYRPLLWIGGRQNQKCISWVSSFSLDFIEAIQMNRAATIVYVLCNSGPDSESPTPLQIFSEVILQILQVQPEILTMPQNLLRLPLQRFEDIRESPEMAYKILADILQMVDEKCRLEGTEMFLLIDRVDIPLSARNTPSRRFLQALQQLVKEYETLRIVLTSQCRPQEIDSLLDGKDQIMEIWVDTTKPQAMYSRN